MWAKSVNWISATGRVHSLLGRRSDLFLDRFLVLGDLLGAQDALLEELLLEALEAVVLGQQVELFLGPVPALVVFRGMRAETVDKALDQGRPVTCARPRDGLFGDCV